MVRILYSEAHNDFLLDEVYKMVNQLIINTMCMEKEMTDHSVGREI